MFKLRDGFTLPEVLMTIGLMSFIALGVIPLLGKDLATLLKNDKLKDFHGIIECYYDEKGVLHEFKYDYTNKEHNREDIANGKYKGEHRIRTNGRCEIDLPDVNYYKVHLISAGTRGYGIDWSEANNIVKALEYDETSNYYGRDLYGASGTTNKIKKSNYDGTNKGTYNIIKLSNDFYKKFDSLPDAVRNLWSDIYDDNDKEGPIVKYEVRPSAGRQVGKVVDGHDTSEDCANWLSYFLSLGQDKDGWREAPEYMLGNPYEKTFFTFAVPPADSGDKQLSFNYNTIYNSAYNGGDNDKPSSKSVIQITDTAKKGSKWKENNFYVGIKYWWKQSPCHGTYDSEEACKVDDKKENPLNGMEGNYTCTHDLALSGVEKLFPFDRPVVYTTSGGDFSIKILKNSVWQDLVNNTMNFHDFDVDNGKKAFYIPADGSYANLLDSDGKTGKHALLFTGLDGISGKCGESYSSDGLPPCFRFDAKKVKFKVPIGKRGANGADYQTVYEKVNAHRLILQPGRYLGENSVVYMIKNEGDEEQILLRTINKPDPFAELTSNNSIELSDSYEPIENVTTTKYSTETDGVETDIRKLLNDTIVDKSPKAYTFANVYSNAEKGSKYGMYNYFNSTDELKNNFGGPGRGGHGAHPMVGGTSIDFHNVTARILDAVTSREGLAKENVPTVIDECLITDSNIKKYQDSETGRYFCNAHPGYGGAVIITW